MDNNWATEHLQVIRTLMERAAVYRRALAPMMLLTGIVGSIASAVGYLAAIATPAAFIGYWLGVSLIPLIGCFLLVRRQALREGEAVWSPPTRRVVQAVLPALIAGLLVSLVVLAKVRVGGQVLTDEVSRRLALGWLPVGWVVLYGCASHAAGFFMPRGIKLFGWLFVAGGCGLFSLGIPAQPGTLFAHGIMGFFFGALHLAYGVYLYFTEKRKNAA